MSHRLKRLFRRFLPSIISGSADNDPAAISSLTISGAQFGYQQLWIVVIATPMLIAVQAMCARIGDLTRKGIMTVVREHYTPVIALVASSILIIANTVTIGANIAGMADAISLITNTPLFWWVIPIAVLLWYIVVFQNYKRIEKYLSFLVFVFLAYVISAVLVHPDWSTIIHTIIFPTISFSPAYLACAVALFGSTITPYVFFWQARQGTEEHLSPRELKTEAKEEDTDVAPGYIYSNIISVFIIISAAAVLHSGGGQFVVNAGDAAEALEPLAGPFAKYLFAVGIIGAGLLAIPIIASSTAYVVAETFGWRESLSDKVNKAKGFYTVLTASLCVGVGIAISGIDPIQALFYSQIFVGLLTPFLILIILFICNDKKIMGAYVNRLFDNIFGFVAVIVMTLVSAGLFWQIFLGKT